jgi:hypothetical protein
MNVSQAHVKMEALVVNLIQTCILVGVQQIIEVHNVYNLLTCVSETRVSTVVHVYQMYCKIAIDASACQVLQELSVKQPSMYVFQIHVATMVFAFNHLSTITNGNFYDFYEMNDYENMILINYFF